MSLVIIIVVWPMPDTKADNFNVVIIVVAVITVVYLFADNRLRFCSLAKINVNKI